jgi:chromosomal replication initiation ATPase DnaA
MKYLTTDYGLKCDTVRKLVKQTWENHQLALAIAKEAGLLVEKDKEAEVKLTVYSYDRLLDILKEYFQVDITKATRKRNVVDARHISYFMLRKYTSLALTQIGDMIGVRDHTTVIHGVRKIRDLISSGDNDIILHVNKLSELIEARFETTEKAA